MSRPLRFVVLCLIALAITTSTELNGSRGSAAAQDDRERFVGAWRLAWLEEPGVDGKIHRSLTARACSCYTRDGFASVR